MQCTLSEAVEKLESIYSITKAISDGRTLSEVDRDIVRDLLSDYRDILESYKIKI